MNLRNNNLIYFIVALFILAGCEKDEDPVPVIETGTVADVEGNVYRTVKIGDQWWMAENLRVKKYRNGISLQSLTSDADWSMASSGGFCTYENDPDNFQSYGLLYNWHAISDTSNLAPEGWHIPTDAEWKMMEMYLGMNQADTEKSGWRGTNEGDKLKIKENIGWSPFGDVWATNESGFTALGGSCRLPNAGFGQPGLKSTGFWWTNALAEGGGAWYRYLDYKNSNVFRSHDSKLYGFSIRCIKD